MAMTNPHAWSYDPGGRIVVANPSGCGTWREVQPEAPAWSWLGASPRVEVRRARTSRTA